uniref:GK19404 n=2 Tax=Drosophila willistoni TaxID=7260 RepID=B4MPY4_DROWI
MPASQINFLEQSEQNLAYDIVDELFGQHDSESLVAPQRSIPSSESYVDQRLKYWKMMLRQRRALQRKLRLATGKQPEELLFNHPTSIEHSSKEQMKRLLDQAKRIDRKEAVEIVGLPRRAATELLGTESAKSVVKSKWLQSKLLEDHVEEQLSNIKRVLEFYPDTNNLEVVGKGIHVRPTGKFETCQSISSSTLTTETAPTLNDTISQMSTATSIGVRSYRSRFLEENLDIALLINGMPYKPQSPEFSPNMERMFVCNPFENILRTVMRIENVGRVAIRFSWMQADFFAYNSTLFEMLDDEFIFDTSPFQLRFGETREVSVLFRPRKVSIVKQRWLLMTRPRIFCHRPCALTLNMHGRCTPSPEYTKLLLDYTLDYLQEVRKSSLKLSFDKLQISNIISEPSACSYPYQRTLEEREAFNKRNKGFNCATFDDMEELKLFYERIKPYPRYPKWDYSVRWLINLVCQHDDKAERLQLFKDLQNLLGRLRGRTKTLKAGDTKARLWERQHTRFVYVRGVIGNGLDIWEEKICLLEKLLLKQRLQSQRADQEMTTNEALVKKVEKELRHSNHFRQSIYLFSYNVLCNLAEDIVSVIESTELV